MHYRETNDIGPVETVGNDIGSASNYQLTCSTPPSAPAELRVIGQRADTCAYRVGYFLGRRWVVTRDIILKVLKLR